MCKPSKTNNQTLIFLISDIEHKVVASRTSTNYDIMIHFKEFIILSFKSVEKLSLCIVQATSHETKCLYFPFSFSFVCLSIILPIRHNSYLLTCRSSLGPSKAPYSPVWNPLRYPDWDSTLAHSHSGKELNISSQKDAHFSGRCLLAY